MQPGVALQPDTIPELPISPKAPGAAGHWTVVLYPTLVPQPDGSAFERYWVKMNVSPLLSERCSVTIGVSGSVTPGFALAICDAFHLVTCPW